MNPQAELEDQQAFHDKIRSPAPCAVGFSPERLQAVRGGTDDRSPCTAGDAVPLWTAGREVVPEACNVRFTCGLDFDYQKHRLERRELAQRGSPTLAKAEDGMNSRSIVGKR